MASPEPLTSGNPDLEARCLGCGYLLRGLEAHRCPECGRSFDPSDPYTMYVGLPVGPVARALLKPTGRGTDAIAYVAAGALLWGEAWLPGGIYVTFTGFLLCGVYFGYRWLRAAIRGVIARNRRRSYEKRRQLRPALVLGVSVLLCMFALPQKFILWTHGPLLRHYVRHLHAEIPLIQAERQAAPRMIGLLYIHDVRIAPSNVRLIIGPRGTMVFCDLGDRYEAQIMEPQVWLVPRGMASVAILVAI